MEQQQINYQDILFDVAQDMAKANAKLQTSIPKQRDCSLKALIKNEIANGAIAADAWRHMFPCSTNYTHTNYFPIKTYEELPEDFLLQLELSDIYLYKIKEKNTAVIKIIFHF